MAYLTRDESIGLLAFFILYMVVASISFFAFARLISPQTPEPKTVGISFGLAIGVFLLIMLFIIIWQQSKK